MKDFDFNLFKPGQLYVVVKTIYLSPSTGDHESRFFKDEILLSISVTPTPNSKMLHGVFLAKGGKLWKGDFISGTIKECLKLL